nr:TetR/AcrR family transcriptional regulator [Streptomyces sp. 3211]
MPVREGLAQLLRGGGLGDGGVPVGAAGLDRGHAEEAARAPDYFPTRDALLRGAAERCAEQYRALATALAGTGPGPADAAQLTTLLAGLLRDVAGPGRPRVLAYLELRAEAARRPWLAALLDPVAASDFAAFAHLLAGAGLPADPEPARALTLALHGAIPHLLTGAPATLAAAGLDDLDRFARDLLARVCEGANR